MGEIFYSIKELRVLAERWRVHFNTVRPHSSLGYRPPAPEAWLTSNNMGYGEVETSFALTTSPHPRLRLFGWTGNRATLNNPPVQKFGHATATAALPPT